MLFDKIFFKFIIAGVLNTIVGAGIMFILYNIAGFGYWPSSAANYIFGGIFSFFLNKYWTFQVKTWSLFMVISFILTIAVSYFIAYGISKPLINHLLINNDLYIRENIALASGMILFTGINYILQRLVVFKKKD